MTDVITEIAAERRRQIEVEGHTTERDDELEDGELSTAAARYALEGTHESMGCFEVIWPSAWDWNWFNPKSRRENLIRAAALLVAEIERLDRATAKMVDASEEQNFVERVRLYLHYVTDEPNPFDLPPFKP